MSSKRPSFEVFYDSLCPLCRREITMLQRLDRHNILICTDIAAPDFDPTPLGKTHEDLMARIHGRLADGTWVEGVEVFRQLYTSVGFGPVVALTRLPPLSWSMELGYRWFAKNRLQLTGRCTDDVCSVPTTN
jgi:predicted DCC family thiol-disulfide oxidoreductase YuxK